ncbi:DUF1365 domain-containing protein [Pararhizobium sp. BT-229]|uniref:DUF1365 domain-containing protein n=1 Tax=Pararhizobium sp. BT-229 TaxID=2986923 RepID=UPI0021F6F283|nr:DUF1365 domain-containing protein [Pararhizobium sp. BT-229]MCV9960425.1 DUF1365 domain-containing protein [Pararhizobium sp. BT-229]
MRSGSSVRRNGDAPCEAAVLYAGKVMHQRMKPVGHRFAYDVFSLMIDLDRLNEADRLSAVFSVNRRNLLSFYESDHTGDAGIPLRRYADALLGEAGMPARPARILLVCYPRILGLVFNPLAVYYAYDEAGALVAMIYEVHNTFGERHTYVCPIMPGEISDAGVRQQCDKVFHVSPFIPMTMRYRFRMLPPAQEIRWRILETDKDGPLLAATFSGMCMPLKTGKILRLVARIPHLTFKIVAGIHWEALKLWGKGVCIVSRPPAPELMSVWKEGRRAMRRPSDQSNVGGPAE